MNNYPRIDINTSKTADRGKRILEKIILGVLKAYEDDHRRDENIRFDTIEWSGFFRFTKNNHILKMNRVCAKVIENELVVGKVSFSDYLPISTGVAQCDPLVVNFESGMVSMVLVASVIHGLGGTCDVVVTTKGGKVVVFDGGRFETITHEIFQALQSKLPD